MLKLICEMGSEEQKTLLIELPNSILKRLEIKNGMISTKGLILALLMSMPSDDVAYTLDRLIFDSKIAVNWNYGR